MVEFISKQAVLTLDNLLEIHAKLEEAVDECKKKDIELEDGPDKDFEMHTFLLDQIAGFLKFTRQNVTDKVYFQIAQITKSDFKEHEDIVVDDDAMSVLYSFLTQLRDHQLKKCKKFIKESLENMRNGLSEKIKTKFVAVQGDIDRTIDAAIVESTGAMTKLIEKEKKQHDILEELIKKLEKNIQTKLTPGGERSSANVLDKDGGQMRPSAVQIPLVDLHKAQVETELIDYLFKVLKPDLLEKRRKLDENPETKFEYGDPPQGLRKRERRPAIIFPNGNVYEGEWQETIGLTFIRRVDSDVREGKGIFIFKNGSMYEGWFKNKQFTGMGRKIWGDGKFKDIIYTGGKSQNISIILEWKYNKMHGNGHLIWPSGSEYKGEFFEDKKHGRGFFKNAANGDTYDGDYVYDQKSGEGTYNYFKDKEMYSGEWANDQKNGIGVFTFSNGKERKGEFENDELVQWVK